MKVIYKIVYPNGKIYVGKDLTDSVNYRPITQTSATTAGPSSRGRWKRRLTQQMQRMLELSSVGGVASNNGGGL